MRTSPIFTPKATSLKMTITTTLSVTSIRCAQIYPLPMGNQKVSQRGKQPGMPTQYLFYPGSSCSSKICTKKFKLRVILYLYSSEWEKQPLESNLMYLEKAQKRDSDPTKKQVRCSLVVPRSKLHCTNKLNMCDLTNGKEDWQQQIGFYFCRIFWILWKLQALHWPSKIKNSAHTSKISTK